MMAVTIAPSILAADFARLGEQVKAAEEASADMIHIDVMDGQFVPNISIGTLIVRACREVTKLPLDVHLMIVRPERFIDDFVEAGADVISLHAEATPHVHRALEQVRNHEIKAGLAVNPLTPLTIFEDALELIDTALLMTVNPGFGGQRFIPSSLTRLPRLKALCEQYNPACKIEVDGGINSQTARAAVQAGADILVAGSAIFSKSSNPKDAIKLLRRSAAG